MNIVQIDDSSAVITIKVDPLSNARAHSTISEWLKLTDISVSPPAETEHRTKYLSKDNILVKKFLWSMYRFCLIQHRNYAIILIQDTKILCTQSHVPCTMYHQLYICSGIIVSISIYLMSSSNKQDFFIFLSISSQKTRLNQLCVPLAVGRSCSRH